jgi:DNA-binding MarR family transcriptional regulator
MRKNVFLKHQMEKNLLSSKEQLMLYGLVKYPQSTDKILAKKLELKHSTVTSIRHRLRKKQYYRTLTIPQLQHMGCNMLVVIYTNFTPLIPLEERVKITGKTIEVFDEIFFSVGEQDKGFSLSLSRDYATIGRINDIRTRTFGERGLLEDEYPTLVVFPFEISKIYRFFDFAPLLKKSFTLDLESEEKLGERGGLSKGIIALSEMEKNVYCMLVNYPESSDSVIGAKLGVSRHTVSRLRRGFEEENLLWKINMPDLKKLGFEILTLYHILFDPRHPLDMVRDEATLLMSDSSIFMASRMFEAFILSVHHDYDDYQRDRTRIMQILKENQWIAEDPMIRTHSLSELIYMKDFRFTPIAKKIVGCDLQI